MSPTVAIYVVYYYELSEILHYSIVALYFRQSHIRVKVSNCMLFCINKPPLVAMHVVYYYKYRNFKS